jgi:hypothetical protein
MPRGFDVLRNYRLQSRDGHIVRGRAVPLPKERYKMETLRLFLRNGI